MWTDGGIFTVETYSHGDNRNITISCGIENELRHHNTRKSAVTGKSREAFEQMQYDVDDLLKHPFTVCVTTPNLVVLGLIMYA